MKLYKIINTAILSILLFACGALTSCEDAINVGKEKENNYISEGSGIYLMDQNGRKNSGIFEFREKATSTFKLKLNQIVSENINASLKYDKAVLDKFNEQNETEYELYPEASVNLENGLNIEIKAGENSSSEIALEFKSDGSLDSKKSYVVPLKVTLNSGGKDLAEKESEFLIFVKDMSGIPSADKYVIGADGQPHKVEIISCMEINDTNPLNNLSFTLDKSGKPLIDIVILFSANINYNPETGRVFVFQNSQVTSILGNREKYLKPLQDKGIKVVLGILPNHDRAGITNLAEETAKGFVQELKAYMEAYQLDGVFWDDEYDKPIYPAPPGFVDPSYEATSFLVHEFNKVMPDKLNMVYVYHKTDKLLPIEGKQGGEYITHALHDYGGYYGLANNYPGLPKSGWGMYSQEFNRFYFTNRSSLIDIKNNGYCHMVFAMDPTRGGYYYYQKPQLRDIATTIFGEELVEGDFFEKDY